MNDIYICVCVCAFDSAVYIYICAFDNTVYKYICSTSEPVPHVCSLMVLQSRIGLFISDTCMPVTRSSENAANIFFMTSCHAYDIYACTQVMICATCSKP